MNGGVAGTLHVAQIGFFNDPAGRAPAELLQAWPSLVDVAEAAAGCGVRVSVVQACSRSEQLERNAVHYNFLPFGPKPHSFALAPLAALLRRLAPDLLHVHGLEFHRQVSALTALLPGVPVVLQDHASRPPRPWRRAGWRRGLAAVSAVSFTAADQAAPFARAGLLGTRTRVYEVPESTSRFVTGNRAAARLATGVHGDPAVLWIGHLDANKDPLTVLTGVSAAAQALPGLRLWCCYGSAPLLPAVEARIAGDPGLRDRVRLLGRVPHARVELLMRAADIFVLGSHREGSGYSLIEALACGLPPVVTDIPSFRALTGAGAVGRLWPCGDARALGTALQSVATSAGDSQRLAVGAHFERELSFAALGAKLAAMYGDIATRAISPMAPGGETAARARTPLRRGAHSPAEP
ncbi:MAG: glycosyltransferase family 4 protein [Proteobacteria bacterium]|nr:glycosyltransferase family 4 protein [Pseudomonadota bacterium]